MKTEISVAQFRQLFSQFMQQYKLKLDCSHMFCFHPLSNTMVVHPNGLMECSECYQSERVSSVSTIENEAPAFGIPASTLNHFLRGGSFMSQNSQQIAVLAVYIPSKKKSITCYVTTQNIKNVMKLVEENLMLEKYEAEAANGKAPEAATSEAVSE